MALKERDELATFVGVHDGKLEVRVKEGTPGSEKREKMKKGKGTGEFIHVKYYGSLEGTIKDVKKDIKEMPDGLKITSLKIYIDDVGDRYILNFPYNSDLTRAFFCMMENINYDFPVEFSTGKSKDKKGKERSSLFVKQHGANIKWRYTKDYEYAKGEEKKPDWEQIEVKGEKVWDNTKEIRFFENIIKTKVLPLLRNKKEEAPKSVADDFDVPEYHDEPLIEDAVIDSNAANGQEDDGDLPF